MCSIGEHANLSHSLVKEKWVHMPKFAANLSWLFTNLDFKDRFAAAAGAGFTGVECLFPYDHAAAEVAELLHANGLEQVLINAPPGDWDSGERGIGCLPGRHDDFRRSVEQALAYAKRIECPRIHVMAGAVPDGVDPKKMQDQFIENLSFAADICGRAGVRVLIEPINTVDMPGYFLCHPDQAVAIIDEVASPHLALQFDIYHVAMMGLDIARHIKRHLPRVAHFQIAGMPGRNEPVGGDIDYPALFDLIDGLEYDGWVGCEYRPRESTLDGLGWLRDQGVKPPASP